MHRLGLICSIPSIFQCVHRCFILLFLVTSATPAFAQQKQFKFKRLTTNEGLSHGHVGAIVKDYKGFMWFGTNEGLNRYDGYRFIAYKHDAENPASLNNNSILDLLEDKEHNLWIGTDNGLNRFNMESDGFVHYYVSGSPLAVRDILQDSENRIWLGTDEGLYQFNPATGKSKRYYYSSADNNGVDHNFIHRMTEGDEDELWIATKGGLKRFNTKTHQFVCYTHDPDKSGTISANWVRAVYKDSKGNIWAGTQGKGISLFNKNENSFTNFQYDPDNRNSVAHNDILYLSEDNDGKLWVGTENGGISVYDHEKNIFTTYQSAPGDNTSLSNNSVHSLYRDNIGNMWAGTWSGGVNFLPRLGDKFAHYKQGQSNGNSPSLSNNIVLSIAADPEGDIWIGTDGGGLNRFDRRNQSFTHYRNDRYNKNSISTDYIITAVDVSQDILGLGYHRIGFDLFDRKKGSFIHLFENKNAADFSQTSVSVAYKDREGNLWLGTHDSGGLCFYDTKKQRLIRYPPNPQNPGSIAGRVVLSLLEDKEGNLWVGTDNGLDLFDRSKNEFIHHRNDPNKKESLSNNTVHSIFEDSDSNLWVGTSGGLNFFDKKTRSFTAYTEKDGLANNSVYGILVDSQGSLWFSSNKGLSRFNPITKICRNYDMSDGLQDNSFKRNAWHKATDGHMFYGGVNGFNVFHPDSIKDNPVIPPVWITDFQIFNKPVGIHEGSPLNKPIIETKEITLSYKQSVFSFEFAALNYTLPEKNRYAYMLEGFDKDWNPAGSRRTATYTNLDPGEYMFRVKGSNNDGVWNEVGTSMKIIVTPPYWLTWWFKSFIFISVIAGIYTFFRIRVNVIKKQKVELEGQVRHHTADIVKQKNALEKQTEYLQALNNELQQQKVEVIAKREEAERANQAKSIFLATMSHEIRTPMNGVLGMASLLADTSLTAEQKEYTETIRNSGEALLIIINDILDFSKIESGKLDLDNQIFDLHQCIEEVMDIFSIKAAQKGLDLIYHIDHRIPESIVGDSHRLRQILLNLISNALKFTHHGEIFLGIELLHADSNKMKLGFSIRDTGIGIPADKLSRLFKAFSQVDSSTTRKYGGTGLGLVISERLVGLMAGHITVKSEPGVGTTFTFSIESLINHDAIRTDKHYNVDGIEGKKVLVVDDNATSLDLFKNLLSQWQVIHTLASSGEQALKILDQPEKFDLIIVDMHMPGMNGVQLAQRIKLKDATIPIILLSSMGDESKVKHPGLFASVLNKPIKYRQLNHDVYRSLRPELDLAPLEYRAPDQALSENFATTYPLQILVADDNPINQTLTIRVLGKLGYLQVEVAQNGLEVLEKLKTKSYDVILMDVQMPEMDGLEATRMIRLQADHQPVIIAMTANAMPEDREICLKAGMNDYISKPIKFEILVQQLEKWSMHIQKKVLK